MSTTDKRITGMVKWFNNKAGFGFITICGENTEPARDIFVHYSSINVADMQYKYLVMGEYVDFTLVESENAEHKFQATKITGVMNGPIMCETRRLMQPTRTYNTLDASEEREVLDDREPPRRRPQLPRYDNANGGGGRGQGQGRGGRGGRGARFQQRQDSN